MRPLEALAVYVIGYVVAAYLVQRFPVDDEYDWLFALLWPAMLGVALVAGLPIWVLKTLWDGMGKMARRR